MKLDFLFYIDLNGNLSDSNKHAIPGRFYYQKIKWK